jgi:ABC-2 type transport system ATP-binding protein
VSLLFSAEYEERCRMMGMLNSNVMNVLEVRNIYKSFGKVEVLKDVSLDIPKQSIFGLLGPNGAGKTTLIRIINQIILKDAGEILFYGKKINRSHVEKIGYLPEERGLYAKMKVGEHLVYMAKIKGIRASKAKDHILSFFREFEIEAWWNKKVEQLSKGMQQKLQFIIAIINQPELIILDEPFTGFDPLNTEVIKKKIIEMKNEGKTFILSTHRMESVEELCDQIALINMSEKILDGTVKDIKEKYKNNVFELRLKGELSRTFINDICECLLEEYQYDPISETSKFNIKLHGNLSLNQLMKQILPHAEIVSLNELLPSIQDIFISLVKASE